MPDSTSESSVNDPAIAPLPQDPPLSDDLKKKLADASGPIWKKILWWVLGFFGVVLGAIGVMYVLKGKSPTTAVKDAVSDAKTAIAKSDMEAKIKVAEAEHAEKAVIDRLSEIKELKDEKARLDALNKLL